MHRDYPRAVPASAGKRVLVEADNFYGVLAGVRGLRTAGYAPWLAAPHRGTYATLSRVPEGIVPMPDPLTDPARFADAIVEAAERIGAAVVLPGSEAGLVALAGRTGLPAGIRVGAPAQDIVARAIDKDILGSLAQAAGLDIPPTQLLARDEAAEAEVDFPVVVKPVRTKTQSTSGELVHGRVHVVFDRSALAAAVGQLPGDRVVIQPHLGGTLAAVAGVAWEGCVICSVHQEARRISPPLVGISAFAETVPPDDALDAGVARLIASVGWSGLFQIQVVRAAGRTYVIDFNPRMYGSLALAIAAGANLPAIWTDLLLGREPSIAPYRIGARYRSEEKEVQAFALAVARHDIRTALDCLRPRRGTTHAAFALNDPRPVLASVRKVAAALRG